VGKEYRTVPAEEIIARLSPARQAKINLRAAQLIAEEVGLGDLRRAKRITQEQVAKKIGGRQVYISRFEKRSDVRLSKLREYVEALGGELELLVTFPDSSAYRLARLGKPRILPRRRPAGRAAGRVGRAG
jgi:Helix-turn-helix domain